MLSAGGPRIVITHKAQTLGLTVAHQRGKPVRLILTRRRLAIEPANGKAIPTADADLIGVGKIEFAPNKLHPWRRIVHDRGPVIKSAAREIMLQAQGMAGFMDGELA